jgi:hypothetical protein
MSIQWRPEVNPLTTPHSYRIQVVPRGTVGYNEMAADIASTNPNFTEEMIKSLGPLMMAWIQQRMINGYKVTLPEACSFYISITGMLDSPDDALPENDEMVQANARFSRPYIKEIRHQAKFERLPMTEKLPVITSTEDTKLKLADVLFAAGVLRLTGSNLEFDESNPNCGCVLSGTRNGQIKQSTFASVSNSAVLVVPEIPAQDAPWNNEYTVTLTTQYSEHGTLRSSTYRRKLRTPIVWDDLPHEGGTGVLTGSAEVPYVTIESGTIGADEMLRIQAVIDSRSGQMLLNLIDMKEDGQAGATVAVTANGAYTLTGFSGSNVSSISLLVHEYDALKDMLHNSYGSRLVDIVDIQRV